MSSNLRLSSGSASEPVAVGSPKWRYLQSYRNQNVLLIGVLWPSSHVCWNQALVFLVSRVWVRVPFITLVSLSKKLDYYSFVLQIGYQAIGSVFPSYTYYEEKGFTPVFLTVAARDHTQVNETIWEAAAEGSP